MRQRKLLLAAGARPNFMKVAPIIRALQAWNQANPDRALLHVLVHTGQHYDPEMSDTFLLDLDIPQPAHFLGVGPGSHAVQTAKVMMAFEEVCAKERPDAVVVVGDVNSTLACALTAKKMGMAVAHVEAGLRSRDLSMPEEINRMVTDALSDWLFASEPSGVENLLAEGRPARCIHLVGNTMVDSLLHALHSMDGEDVAEGLPGQGPYALLTLHRPTNVDPPERLKEIMGAVELIGRDLPVYFPVHPRTKARLQETGLATRMAGDAVRQLPPLGYKGFLRLLRGASLVLTDSGGLQEETTVLGIPCFTIRDNTERPITVQEGTNTLVGTSREGILAAFELFRKGRTKKGRRPALWDGGAAKRIVEILARDLEGEA